jgi:hypothetical protein
MKNKNLFLLCPIIFVGLNAFAGTGGFLCDGPYLYNSGAPSIIDNAGSASACQAIVNSSKNSFACDGQYLFNSTAPSIIDNTGSPSACQAMVNSSH